MKISVTFSSRKKIGLAALGFTLLLGATAFEANAQTREDPFRKPVVAAPKKKAAGRSEKAKPAGPTAVTVPPIQQRIDNYKVVRQRCAELGIVCPKPTSVLTLDEMQVIGVFRTPRGHAAMVEATPIKLSYTIYPGEKFYDGQLVAVEEGKLVFRRTVQMSNGKEVVSVENKVLRQATINDLAATRNDAQTSPTATTAPTTKLSAEAVPETAPATEDKQPAAPSAPAKKEP